jgi:histidine triad (HIT) family protein
MNPTSVKPCVFCSIIREETPAAVVQRTEHSLAFLDTSPVFKGHVLIVPLTHVITLADLPAAQVGDFFSDVQRVSAVLPNALGADGTFVANNNIVSQSVAHLHVHVVPRRRKDGLRGFFWPRQRYDVDEMNDYARVIERAIRDSRAEHS